MQLMPPSENRASFQIGSMLILAAGTKQENGAALLLRSLSRRSLRKHWLHGASWDFTHFIVKVASCALRLLGLPKSVDS